MAKNIKLKGRRRRSAIICILLVATALLVSFSLVSSTALPDQQTVTPMPVQTSQKSSPSAQPAQSDYEPQFNVEIAYAFVGKGPSEVPLSLFGWDVDYPESQYPSVVYFNVTPSAAPVSCDALIEVFLIKIISDKGPTESYAYFEGTNYEPSFSDSALTSLTARIYDLIDPSTVNGVTGHFRFNWTDNTPIFGGQVGSFGVYSSNPTELGLWSVGKPNTISVTVRRIGCVIMNGGSISVRANAISANALQLPKFGDGFLYNKVVPADKLAQIKLQTDLFQPLT